MRAEDIGRAEDVNCTKTVWRAEDIERVRMVYAESNGWRRKCKVCKVYILVKI